MKTPVPSSTLLPYLRHVADPAGSSRLTQVAPLPFHVGRRASAHCVLQSPFVSQEHAAIVRIGDQFHIRDLGSTNGTFLNRRRVTEALLSDGDIIHFAQEEFQFLQQVEPSATEQGNPDTKPVHDQTPASLIHSTQQLSELLAWRAVRTIFQPIVHLDSGTPFGYEALLRSTHSHLNGTPTALFSLADRCGLSTALSQLSRRVALEEASLLPAGHCLFLNLHHQEIGQETLLESLREAQALLVPHRPVVLEVNENAVADVPTFLRFRMRCRELGMRVAFDDFGAGQARLLELAEVPPDFIKLDMRLIRDIHCSRARYQLLRALSQASTDLGVEIIAEGIETQEEADGCRDLGCRFGQGYLFGRPQSVGTLQTRNHGTRVLATAELRRRLLGSNAELPARSMPPTRSQR